MTGSGPAGETVWADVASRLAAAVAHLTGAEAGHDRTADEVAAAVEDAGTDRE